ncbi:MAG: tetratricopeptide repeat protein [Planctomycetota bacterium]|jgi:tetratricopeptide (TPR) repeat protein
MEPHRLERPRTWLWVIVLLTFGLYAASFGNGYTYDDKIFVRVPSAEGQPNEMVGQLKPIQDYWSTWYGVGVGKSGRGYRPLTVYSYALVQRLGRVKDPAVTVGYSCSAAWHHVVNVILHCLATLLVYWIVVLFLGPGIPALVAAAVFGLHALRSDPVICLVGRAEILGFLLGAVALLLYVAALRRGDNRRWLLLVPTALAVFLALSSKESAVAWTVFIPLTVVALGWQGHQLRGFWAQLPAAVCTMAVPLLIWFWLREQVLLDIAADPTHPDFAASYQANPLFRLPFLERASSGVMILAFGLFKVFVPFHLACDYGAEVFTLVQSMWDLRLLLSFLVLVGILGAGLWWARRQPLLFLAMAAFLGFTFPISNIPLPIETIFGERLYYTPAVGLSFLLAWLGHHLCHMEHRKHMARWGLAGGVVLLVWLGICSVCIVQRCQDWKDSDTLFTTDAANQPDSISMQMAAASVYRQRSDSLGEPQATKAHGLWKRHLDRAHALNPEAPLALNDLAAYYYDQAMRASTAAERERNLATAEEWLWKGIRTPHYDLGEYIHNMYRQLAMIHVQRKQYDQAEQYFLAAIKANDRDPDIKMDLGTLYFHSGRREEATRLWRELTRDTPGYVRAWDRLMRTAAAEGRDDEVVRLIQEAEGRLRNAPFLNVHRGLLEFRRGRFQQAVGHFEGGLPYLPDVAARWEQWLCYGRAAYSTGDVARAAEILRRIAPLLPTLPPEARHGFADLDTRLRHGR